MCGLWLEFLVWLLISIHCYCFALDFRIFDIYRVLISFPEHFEDVRFLFIYYLNKNKQSLVFVTEFRCWNDWEFSFRWPHNNASEKEYSRNRKNKKKWWKEKKEKIEDNENQTIVKCLKIGKRDCQHFMHFSFGHQLSMVYEKRTHNTKKNPLIRFIKVIKKKKCRRRKALKKKDDKLYHRNSLQELPIAKRLKERHTI